MASEQTRRSVFDYRIPDVELIRHDGARVSLRGEVSSPQPLFLNFIYTTCTTVCPVTSRIFSELQLGLARQNVRASMLSISIDPLEDTPPKLAAYAKTYRASNDWHFLTGTPDACLTAQRAFDVYRGDKMNHPAVTFFRPSAQARWVRIEGFATPNELLSELGSHG